MATASAGVMNRASGFAEMSESIRAGQAQGWVGGWGADYPDPQNFLELNFHSQSLQNRTGYWNPETDALLGRARGEPDTAGRLSLYQAAEEIVVRDAPWMPLFYNGRITLARPYVRDLPFPPMTISRYRYAWIDESRRSGPTPG